MQEIAVEALKGMQPALEPRQVKVSCTVSAVPTQGAIPGKGRYLKKEKDLDWEENWQLTTKKGI